MYKNTPHMYEYKYKINKGELYVIGAHYDNNLYNIILLFKSIIYII